MGCGALPRVVARPECAPGYSSEELRRQAAHRRRVAKKLRKAAQAKARELKRDMSEAGRLERERQVTDRMLRRFVPLDRRHSPILSDFRYWQLRKFGYDVFKPELRPGLCAPSECPTWLWWCGLEFQRRYYLAGGGKFTLKDDLRDARDAGRREESPDPDRLDLPSSWEEWDRASRPQGWKPD